jgi:hypothetical protein
LKKRRSSYVVDFENTANILFYKISMELFLYNVLCAMSTLLY